LAALSLSISSNQFVLAQSAPPDLEQAIDNLQRAFDAIEALAAEIPRDTFDTEAALDIAGYDVEEVFAWVRDNTYLVPYRGALRGPVGVLMDRVGNSLDRALLLNELLQLLGFETRLARAELTVEQAASILHSARGIPGEGALLPTDAMAAGDEAERLAAAAGLDAARARADAEQAVLEGERLRTEARERTAEQTARLAAFVGPPSEAALAAERDRQLAAATDHWWVQFQDGRDWIDLDPTLPDAVPGDAIAAAVETMAVMGLGELPAQMLHAVEIRIVLECWRDGGLIETVLLDSEPLVPADLLVTDLSLQHIAVDWPADLGFEGAADPGQALLAAARAQDRWVPALRIGDALLLDQAYGADCRLEPATETLSTVGKLGGAIGEALGGFGDILGGLGGPPAEAQQAGQVTALWIDYTLSVPGEAPEVVRRQVFDLVGPAARSAGLTDMPILSEEQQLGWRLGLLGSTEILIQASDWSPDFVANRTLRTQIAKPGSAPALPARSSGRRPCVFRRGHGRPGYSGNSARRTRRGKAGMEAPCGRLSGPRQHPQPPRASCREPGRVAGCAAGDRHRGQLDSSHGVG
jgi:hypothetical protein